MTKPDQSPLPLMQGSIVDLYDNLSNVERVKRALCDAMAAGIPALWENPKYTGASSAIFNGELPPKEPRFRSPSEASEIVLTELDRLDMAATKADQASCSEKELRFLSQELQPIDLGSRRPPEPADSRGKTPPDSPPEPAPVPSSADPR